MITLSAENLSRTFKVYKRKPGLTGAIANLLAPRSSIVKAVDNVTLSASEGEIIGYLGPNGAGKSTTIKMLCGILRPTGGQVLIHGLDPQKNRKEVARKIGAVFGQRSQLLWDLRLGESFQLERMIYQIPMSKFNESLERMDHYLNVLSFIDTPVRQLSLGQRMRGEIAVALLHNPKVLFLDEPTIGLDIEAKHGIRAMIRAAGESGTTVILTTHDLQDVEELCSRLIIINHGTVAADGPLDVLLRQLSPTRILKVDFIRPEPTISHPLARVIKSTETTCHLEFDPQQITAPRLISDLAARHELKHFHLDEPGIEDLVHHYYSRRSALPVQESEPSLASRS